MPLYFFDVNDGAVDVDEMEASLPDLRAAERQALRVATDLVAAMAEDGDEPIGHGRAIVVRVRNGTGEVRSTVRLVFTVNAG